MQLPVSAFSLTSQGYLKPVTQNTASTNPSHLSKYKVFSLKALCQCIVLLQAEPDPTKQDVLMKVSQQCYLSLLACGDVPGQFPPHTFNSLLLDLAKVCFKTGRTEQCLKSCEVLQSRLPPFSPRTLTFAGKGGGKGAGVMKQMFGLLWRVSTQLDKKERERNSGELVLSVRQRALQNLLGSDSCDLGKVLEYVMKAEHLFTQSTSPPALPHQIDVVSPFHASLLPHSALPELVAAAHTPTSVVPVAQYLLHRAVLAERAGQESEGEELVQRAISYVREHAKDLPMATQALAIQLWRSIRTSQPER